MALPQTALDFMAGHLERLRRLGVKKRIVFPEGYDMRVVEAAARFAREGLGEPVLIGPKPSSPPAGVRFVEPDDKYAPVYYERRRARGTTPIEARDISRRPLYYASLMVSVGDADGFVGGAANTTAETFRAAIVCIGLPPRMRTVSTVYFMAVPDRQHGHNGIIAFSDCAVVIDPTPMQLADITIATAGSVRMLMGVEPAIALLSFSTKGSAKHAYVDQVREALRIVRARAPELHVDGELQADAALIPAVGASKAPGSTVAGRANTLIFPDLGSANIGYKLVERLASGAAIGPITQGLAKPANDLSRGCSAADIFNLAVITALQAAGAR